MPAMPQLVAKLVVPYDPHSAANPVILWKLQVSYQRPAGDQTQPEDTVIIPKTANSADPNAVGGWHKITDGTPWNIYQNPDWTAAVAQGFFGGDAVLSVKVVSSDDSITILPQMDWKFRIAGENPDPTKCEAYINQTYNGPTPNWTGSDPTQFNGYWFAYAIAKEETDGEGGRTYYNQFQDASRLDLELANQCAAIFTYYPIQEGVYGQLPKLHPNA